MRLPSFEPLTATDSHLTATRQNRQTDRQIDSRHSTEHNNFALVYDAGYIYLTCLTSLALSLSFLNPSAVRTYSFTQSPSRFRSRPRPRLLDLPPLACSPPPPSTTSDSASPTPDPTPPTPTPTPTLTLPLPTVTANGR